MRLFSNLLPFYYSPEGDSGGSLGVSDMVDLMGENDNPDETNEEVVPDQSADLLADDKTKDTKDNKESDKEGKEKQPDEKELELEPELEDEELDQTEDVPRKEILKKYPTLFKDFPQLEKAYYREQRYAELLPTIEDAKAAVDKATNFDNFEQSLFKGSIESVFTSLREANPQAYAKVVDNLLPNLQKSDKDAYYHTIATITKNLIAGMVTESNRINNDQLKAAAVVLNQFIFGTSEYTPPQNFSKEADKPNEEQEALRAERAELVQERFNTVLEDISSRSQNVIKSTISKHIDPKSMMTDYVKNVAISEALQSVESQIENDTRFRAQQDKLWERAYKTKFSRDSVEAIQRAYLNKARTLLPAAIQKSRNAALKGLGKRVADEREEPQRKGPIPVGRSASADRSKESKVPQGMKTLDYLMSD